jgi:hypothetical protein
MTVLRDGAALVAGGDAAGVATDEDAAAASAVSIVASKDTWDSRSAFASRPIFDSVSNGASTCERGCDPIGALSD